MNIFTLIIFTCTMNAFIHGASAVHNTVKYKCGSNLQQPNYCLWFYHHRTGFGDVWEMYVWEDRRVFDPIQYGYSYESENQCVIRATSKETTNELYKVECEQYFINPTRILKFDPTIEDISDSNNNFQSTTRSVLTTERKGTKTRTMTLDISRSLWVKLVFALTACTSLFIIIAIVYLCAKFVRWISNFQSRNQSKRQQDSSLPVSFTDNNLIVRNVAEDSNGYLIPQPIKTISGDYVTKHIYEEIRENSYVDNNISIHHII